MGRLPTASGPMPVATVINGVHYAVHSDHLNTPRRLSDASKVVKWQWPYSGFGEIAPQATPATGQAAISYSLRYPGQIDDGNGLFYNWNRFYDPRVGRYTSSDPIGLEGGCNRFGYVGANPLGFVDPEGLRGLRQALRGPASYVMPGSGHPDTVERAARRYEKDKEKKNGYDPFTGPDVPLIPQPGKPYCRKVCPDEYNRCGSIPSGAIKDFSSPGCYTVCTPFSMSPY